MAKFELTKLEIVKSPKASNDSKSYLSATLINSLAPLDTNAAVKYAEFNDAIIDLYANYIPLSKGGNATEDNVPQLPDSLKYLSGHYVTWAPPKESIPFTKQYVTKGTHKVNGKDVPHEAGDTVVDRKGNIVLYDSCTVFCKYYLDPDFPGIPQYYRGFSPAEAGQKYFSAFCSAYKQQLSHSDESTDGAIGSIPAPTAAPVAKTPIGYNPETGEPIYAD